VVAVTLLTLGSAALHVTWNLLLKTSDDRLLAAWAQSVAGGLVMLPVVAAVGLPSRTAMVALVASCLVHVLYLHALARAYDSNDFSFAYPLARGAGAFLAALGSIVALGDELTSPGWAGVATIVTGLVLLCGKRPTRHALCWAALTGATIGTYSILDAAGARRSTGITYSTTLALGIGFALTLTLVIRGCAPSMLVAARTQWRRHLLGGTASVAAYAMVLTATRLAPLGYVAPLRETSVVLGAIAGWLLLNERLGQRRAITSGIVTSGLILLVATQAGSP
jgi:uncharacterized membrane protein